MAEIMSFVLPVVGEAVKACCGLVLTTIKKVWNQTKEFKPQLEQLKSTVSQMTPIFKDIERLNRAVNRPEPEYAVFGDVLVKANSLVLKCAKARWWNKSSYAKKLIEYDRSLTRFFQINVPAQILHGVCRVEGDLAGKRPTKEESEEEAVPFAGGLAVDYVDVADPIDLLRNSPQFQALLPLLQNNRHILKGMLQGLGKEHPHILELIEGHKAEFLQLIYGPVDDILKLIEDHKDLFEESINEPVDGSDGDLIYQRKQEMHHAINVSQAEQEMPHAINVTPAEQEAIERLEEMGFDGDLVIEAFLACDGNEELAVNYLLENAGYFED